MSAVKMMYKNKKKTILFPAKRRAGKYVVIFKERKIKLNFIELVFDMRFI